MTYRANTGAFEAPRESAHDSFPIAATPAAAGTTEQHRQIPELWRMLLRRKWILVSVTMLGTIAAALALAWIPATYTASAVLLLNARGNNVVDIQSVRDDLSLNRNAAEVINSEVAILTSRGLAERVIALTNLVALPGFAAAKDDSRIPILGKFLKKSDAQAPAQTAEERLTKTQERVLRRYSKALSVRPGNRSFAISVKFDSHNPQLASRVVNTIVETYVRDQVDAKSEAARRASAWLIDRVNELRVEVRAGEDAAEIFRVENGLIEGVAAGTIVQQQVSELNSDLIAARSALAESGARLSQVSRLVDSGNIEAAAGVLESALIQTLRGQEAVLAQRNAQLASELGPRHPLLLTARAELQTVRGKISDELRKQIENLRTEVAVARARASAVESDLARVESIAGDANRSTVGLRALERESEAARQLLQIFLNRQKETREQASLQEPDAQIISYAQVPEFPSKPRKKIILAGAVIFSAMIGLVLVFVVEQFDTGFRSTDEMESYLGVPSLGLLPVIRGRNSVPAEHVIDMPTSGFSESLRALRTSLHLGGTEKSGQVVLVTSSVPGEGKTSTAVSLARLSASMGERILLIDCDNRRPQSHKIFGVPNEPGLVEYLEERTDLFDVVSTDARSTLHFIVSGRAIVNSANLYRSEQMRHLLSQFRSRYDMVILDSPPVLALPDARLLSAICDATVFVTKWRSTRRDSAAHGLRQVLEAGGQVAGVLLTQVDVRKHAAYGFSDTGYYGHYSEYTDN